MSAGVVLRLRTPLTERVEVAGVTPDRCAARSEYEIAALPAWFGSTQMRLGDLFDVRGGRAEHVVLQGDLRLVDGLGEGTTGGNSSSRGMPAAALPRGFAADVWWCTAMSVTMRASPCEAACCA